MTDPAHSTTVVIINERGLHARAAAAFVRVAETFSAAEVTVRRGAQTVPGTSIMGLLMLGAGPGAQIEISTTGAASQEALTALSTLVRTGFGELPPPKP